MDKVTEIEELWKAFDEGHKHSNDTVLIRMILDLLSYLEGVPDADIAMYKRILMLLEDGGFLVKEEKQFLINYYILLVARARPAATAPLVLEQLRDCSSILDVWPDKQRIKVDYSTGSHRKEFLVWYLRMYETLGNHFLHRRGHAHPYSDMELAMKLKDEKCKLRDSDYPALEYFLTVAASFVEGKDHTSADLEAGLKTMRKMIWKVKEGIAKYS